MNLSLNVDTSSIPLPVISDPRAVEKILGWRDSMAATPRSADTHITVLRALLKYGLNYGILTNTAAGIGKLYVGGGRNEIIWLPSHIERFVKQAAAMKIPAASYAIRLACLTGLRRADLVTMTQAHIKDVMILKKALKSSRGERKWVTIPRVPSLDRLLEEIKLLKRLPGVQTLLVDDEGRSWHPDRLTRTIKEVCDAGGIRHIDRDTDEARGLHLHDCRGSFATRLMIEGGLADSDVADILGWSKEVVRNIRRLYVSDAAHGEALGRRIRKYAETNTVLSA